MMVALLSYVLVLTTLKQVLLVCCFIRKLSHKEVKSVWVKTGWVWSGLGTRYLRSLLTLSSDC